MQCGCDESETEPSEIDVYAVTCDLHGHCSLTGYVEIAAVELLRHVIIKEEIRPLVERNIMAAII